MSAAVNASALGRLPLFAGLSPSSLEAIRVRLRSHTFPPGAGVITADTPGEAVYLVLDGTVKIKADHPDGREVIVAILGPGSVFGEMSVLDSCGRSADVVTQEESTLLWLDRSTFNALVESEAVVARNLLHILTARLRLSTEQIRALCTLDVYGMVARQLVAFAELYGEEVDGGIRIPFRLTQSDIAGMVGASRERVNQAFVSLRDAGLISADGRHRITVLDAAKLRDIVRQR